jgi:hypothetical protein
VAELIVRSGSGRATEPYVPDDQRGRPTADRQGSDRLITARMMPADQLAPRQLINRAETSHPTHGNPRMTSTSQLPLIIRGLVRSAAGPGALSTLMRSIAPGHEHRACDAH